jgi:hypothetical protein
MTFADQSSAIRLNWIPIIEDLGTQEAASGAICSGSKIALYMVFEYAYEQMGPFREDVVEPIDDLGRDGAMIM